MTVELDRLADRADAGVGAQGLDLTSLRVDRVDGSPEAGGQEVREQGGADRAWAGRCTDERDGARAEERSHALGSRLACACLGGHPRLLGLRSRKEQVDDAGVGRATDLQVAVPEDVEHLVVVAEDIGAELRDAALARDAQQMLEQHRADAAPLVFIGDRERHLGGRVLVVRDVSADSDDPLRSTLAQGGDEGDVVHEIRAGEVVQIALAQPPLHAHESEADRALAEAVEVLDQSLAIIRADGAHMDRSAVAQDLFDRVVAKVGAHATLVLASSSPPRRAGTASENSRTWESDGVRSSLAFASARGRTMAR